ncbi:hypothetical protein MMC34_000545 [Xylographa carneopallida]|nr:hypothetical protein [Xylographa carneopallida]
MLRMQPSDSVERMLIGGLSFWKSDTSSRTSRSDVSKVARNYSRQPIFEAENDREGRPLYNAKGLTKIERQWIRERNKELEILVTLYSTIAENLTSSPYTEIPLAILKANNPHVCASFVVFMRNCRQVVLREFRGLDEGFAPEYMSDLYNISEVEGLSHQRRLLIQPVITNMMWSLNKRLWPTEREAWFHNLDNLETLSANKDVGGQNIHLSLKSQLEKVYGHRVWHLLDDSVLLTVAAYFFANVSSLTLSGGVADNVTLFGLLTALSAHPDNLQSLTYLPEIQETKIITSKHPCPLFSQFKSLVDVHLGCSACPDALKASRSVSTAINRKKRWLIDWPTVTPCLCWREQMEREKHITTTQNPCTILATLLEGCRSAMYAIDGHYSKIAGACGKYDDSLWHLELSMRIDRTYIVPQGMRGIMRGTGKLAFDVIFIPLSYPPQASVQVKGSATRVSMVEDDVLGQWRNGNGWPAQPPRGVPMPARNPRGLSWDVGQ